MSFSHVGFSPPLRTALIGLGRIGFGYHAPAIVAHRGFQFVGVADPLAERRAEATAQWQVPAFESVADLLQRTHPDLVVVASPSAFHHEHTCAAFAAGAHVLCDKPVARTLAEFDAMLAAGNAAGKRLVAYQPARIRTELRTLRDLLARNLIGPVHTIKRTNAGYVRRNDWQSFRANGGGMLNNYASHQLDEQLAVLSHAPIRSVFCQTRCVATAGDAEDVVKIVLVDQNGVLVDIDISQAAAQPMTAWQVFGAHGAATWDATARAWQVRYYVPSEAPALARQTGLAAAGRKYAHENLPWRDLTISAPEIDENDYYELLWRHLVRDEPAPVTPDETRQLIQLIERCRASATSGQVT